MFTDLVCVDCVDRADSSVPVDSSVCADSSVRVASSSTIENGTGR